jgi:hypothetical protein
MRFIAAGWIVKRAVNQFLQDEVPTGVMGEIGRDEDFSEVLQVAVKITDDKDFPRLQLYEVSAAVGCLMETLPSLGKCAEEFVDIGHGVPCHRGQRRRRAWDKWQLYALAADSPFVRISIVASIMAKEGGAGQQARRKVEKGGRPHRIFGQQTTKVLSYL